MITPDIVYKNNIKPNLTQPVDIIDFLKTKPGMLFTDIIDASNKASVEMDELVSSGLLEAVVIEANEYIIISKKQNTIKFV